MEQIVRTQQEQARSQHELLTLQQELLRKQALAELDRLLIKPIFSPRSSGSSRSPHPDARLALKVQTIDYYGLWDSSDEPDPTKRRVFTMLPNSPSATPTSVPFHDAILAHVWPSSQSVDSLDLGRLLQLPEGFNVDPRNFLILSKSVELAYDADALLLLPRRGIDGAPPAAIARVFEGRLLRLPDSVKAKLPSYGGQQLHLPRASEGRIPFMRLLAWKAVSALRAAHEETDSLADLPSDVHLDATVTHNDEAVGAAVGASARAVDTLKRLGARFLPVPLS